MIKTALNSDKAKKKAKPLEVVDQDSHVEDRALQAEMREVQARPKTVLATTYRGRK